MEFEGTLSIERPPGRRWVPIVGVVVPVVLFVLVAAWFIRAYVAPPMAAIPAPMVLAAVPVKAPAPTAAPAPAPANPAPTATSEAPAAEVPAPATAVPVFASLAAAPPLLSPATAPAAFADPARDAAMPNLVLEPSEPIAGPIPLPPTRPRITVAQVIGAVPLPRPRPAEASPTPQASEPPRIDRHSAE